MSRHGDSMMRIRRGIAAALAGAAFIVTSCRDQGPEPLTDPDTYVLESIAGQPLPLQLSDPGSAGAFVTIHDGRIRFGPDSIDGVPTSQPRMHFVTTAEIIRRDSDGEKIVAEGESSATYLFDREELAIFPYRVEEGKRVDAPFWLEVSGDALVMHSDEDALRNWRFIR